MRRPSIYSKDYYKIKRRRKIAMGSIIVCTVLIVITMIYNKAAMQSLQKLTAGLKLSQRDKTQQLNNNPPQSGNSQQNDGKSQDGKTSDTSKNQEETSKDIEGEYTVKLPSGDSLTMITEKKDNDTIYKGIKDSQDISYNISDDGKSIVFDYPKSSDIWICAIGGQAQKLNPDTYKEYDKASIMKQYGSSYIWAAKPFFLKDGRIVYQSYLPWFKNTNSYYLWVVGSDGKNNRLVTGTDQGEPVKYAGFTDNGELIIEYGGAKFSVNIDSRSKKAIN
jgi:hypothetical protein